MKCINRTDVQYDEDVIAVVMMEMITIFRFCLICVLV